MPDENQIRAFIGIARQSGVSEATIDHEVEVMLRKAAAPARPGFGFHPSAQPEQQAVRPLPSAVANPIAFPNQLQEEADRRQELRTAVGLGVGIPAGIIGAAYTGPGGAYVGTAAGNLAIEGLDKLIATTQGHPEEGPSLGGAAARTALGPAMLGATELGARGLALAAPITRRTVSGLLQTARAGMGRLGPAAAVPAAGAEADLAARTLSAAQGAARRMSGAIPARDAVIDKLDAKMGQFSAEPIVEKLRTFWEGKPEAALPAYRSAQQALNHVADMLEGEGKIGYGRFFQWAQAMQRGGFKETGGMEFRTALRQVQHDMMDEIKNKLGPAASNEFSALQAKIGNRWQAIKDVSRNFSAKGAESKISNILKPKNDVALRALEEFEQQTGIPLATHARRLAVQRELSPDDRVMARGISHFAARAIVGGGLGAMLGGHGGGMEGAGTGAMLGFLLTSPAFARATVKFLARAHGLAGPAAEAMSAPTR